MTEKSLIIYVFDCFNTPNAGSEGQFIALTKGIDRAKYDLHIVLLNPSNILESLALNIPISSLNGFSLKNVRNWYQLYKLLKQLGNARTCILHTFFIDSSMVVPLLNIFLGHKTIISRRDLGYWYTSSYLKVLNFSGKFVHQVIANSHAVKNIVSEKEGIDQSRINVIYNAYKFSEQSDATPKPNDFSNESSPPINLIIVANIRPVKRIFDAVSALSMLQNTNVTLTVVGGGDPQSLIALADELNVSERLILLGEQANVLPLLKKADIGLLCSESEGFSNAIIEYHISYLPVVCSAVGGNIEAVDDGVDGCLYPMGDVEALTDKLNILINSASKRREMGAAGFRKANCRHSPDVMIAHTERVYQSVFNN